MEQLAVSEYRNLINFSARAFSARMVEPEKLRCLLEGAARTQSHQNEQPWNFVITRTEDSIEYQRLLSCLTEAAIDLVRGAPVLMLAVVRLNHGSDGTPNRYAFRDVRHAISNLALRAKGMGLVTHQIAGFDSVRAHSQFQIPRGYSSTAVIALGYPVGADHSTSDLQEQEKNGHRPLESFVFAGSWGQPSNLFVESSPNANHLQPGCDNAGEISLAIA